MWTATFQSNGIDQAGMTRQTMMRRFREYMMLNHPITRGRSQKAAFAVDDPSIFLAANSNADQRVDGDAHHVETGNSQVENGVDPDINVQLRTTRAPLPAPIKAVVN